MTLYEFRCESCGERFTTDNREAQHHVDQEIGPCGPLKRIWSVGFQIKSTDWSHD